MIWLEKTDFEVQIKNELLGRVSSNNDANLQEAERMAISELQSYLRPKYDTEMVFSTIGNERHKTLVMLTVDILLYHLHSRVATGKIPTIRVDRYTEAKRILEDAAKGVIDLGLPRRVDDKGGVSSRLLWGSDKRREY